MKTKLSFFAAVFSACSALASYTEISLVGAQAWSSSENSASQCASKAIDESGYTAGAGALDGTVDQVDNNMWRAKNDTASNHWWMIKFPTEVSVGAFKLWNYNNGGYLGFKGADIYISSDENIEIPSAPNGNSLPVPAANWELVRPYAFFPQCGSANSIGCNPICLGGNHRARYFLIRQTVQHANGDSSAPGFAEIKFYSHTWEYDESNAVLSDGNWVIPMRVVNGTDKTLQAGAGTSWQNWTGITVGAGDIDFTDVFTQTGWKVVKLREQVFNNGDKGAGSWDRVSGFIGPDVLESGGSVFSGQSRATYVRYSDNLVKFSLNDFEQCGSNFGVGMKFYPEKMPASMTVLGAGNQNGNNGLIKNGLDFSACTGISVLPTKTLTYASGGFGPLVWPSSIVSVGTEAFVGSYGLDMTFTGAPPEFGDGAFNHQSNTSFITIRCDNVKYPAWNDWVTAELTDEEKELYPGAFGWSLKGVSGTSHANLLMSMEQPQETSGIFIFFE